MSKTQANSLNSTSANVVKFPVEKPSSEKLSHQQFGGQFESFFGQNKKGGAKKAKPLRKSGYNSYAGMHQRCDNPNHKDYPNYGGRGISYPDDWKSFDGFIADMGPPPFEDATLDRIDNDADYSRENCRWADKKDQARNRSTNHLLTHNGRTCPLSQWAELYEMSAAALAARLKAGWSLEEALHTPINRGGDRRSGAARNQIRDNGGPWPNSLKNVPDCEDRYRNRHYTEAQLSRAAFFLQLTRPRSERLADELAGCDPDMCCEERMAESARLEMLRAEARSIVADQKQRQAQRTR